MEVKIPVLAENVKSGTVVKSYVSEGDSVKKDQEILELETEKAVVVLPSPAAGVVAKIHVKEGDEVQVGQVVFSISEKAVPAAEEKPKKEATVKRETPSVPPTVTRPGTVPSVKEGFPLQRGLSPAGVPASPSIRKLALELGIDLTRVQGSERGGRIVMEDVRAYIEKLQTAGTVPSGMKGLPLQGELSPLAEAAGLPDFKTWGPVHKEPASLIRKKIASKMSQSWKNIPHVTQFDEADITELSAWIKKNRAQYEKKGAHLTLTPFVIKAAVTVLKKYPKFNSSWDDLRGEIIFKDYYHFGIAVGTEQGLIVPVIRDVDKKDILKLSKELKDLSERTRQRKVTLDELQGGTFTISNQGGIGGGHFTPIINFPEVALLGIGRALVRPVTEGAKIVQRLIVPLSLSYDHRVIDGADAARCIKDLVEEVEKAGRKK